MSCALGVCFAFLGVIVLIYHPLQKLQASVYRSLFVVNFRNIIFKGRNILRIPESYSHMTGLSSRRSLTMRPIASIWGIWETAIARGIGCRVSAGYGQPIKHPDAKLLTVGLRGQGLASQLFDKTGELRPNMFKAALRGHTLRLFSGVTDEATAQELTRELWGGFAGQDGAVVGMLGIAFHAIELDMDSYRYGNVTMPIYDLTAGSLNILCMKQVPEEYKQQLKLLAQQIIRFSMLLGGFGKSWRRVNHEIFFPDYLKHKPMIGCHWEFTNKSTNYYFPVNHINHVTNILNNVQTTLHNWLTFTGRKPGNIPGDWRESWHPQTVQVWGRIAEDEDDSAAVRWFHGNYQGNKTIKGSSLTGRMSQIGRIWHRMYPHYIRKTDGNLKRKGREYVELLTIFSDKSDEQTLEFLKFLNDSEIFIKLWGK